MSIWFLVTNLLNINLTRWNIVKTLFLMLPRNNPFSEFWKFLLLFVVVLKHWFRRLKAFIVCCWKIAAANRNGFIFIQIVAIDTALRTCVHCLSGFLLKFSQRLQKLVILHPIKWILLCFPIGLNRHVCEWLLARVPVTVLVNLNIRQDHHICFIVRWLFWHLVWELGFEL